MIGGGWVVTRVRLCVCVGQDTGVVVGVVWDVCDLTTCDSDRTGVGVSVGITIGASMGLTLGLGLGFSVGIFLDLLVFTAVVGFGACDW